MNNNINVITQKEELYDKCENMEELYDKFYYPLLVEYKELKKQLENKYSRTGTLTNEVLYEENTKLINQQKEFIKWLENYLELFNYDNIDEQGYYDMLEEILQKYKEIIGDDK